MTVFLPLPCLFFYLFSLLAFLSNFLASSIRKDCMHCTFWKRRAFNEPREVCAERISVAVCKRAGALIISTLIWMRSLFLCAWTFYIYSASAISQHAAERERVQRGGAAKALWMRKIKKSTRRAERARSLSKLSTIRGWCVRSKFLSRKVVGACFPAARENIFVCDARKGKKREKYRAGERARPQHVMKRDGKLFSFCSTAPLAQIRKVQLECGEKGFAERSTLQCLWMRKRERGAKRGALI